MIPTPAPRRKTGSNYFLESLPFCPSTPQKHRLDKSAWIVLMFVFTAFSRAWLAVIGVDLDYVELSAAGSMVMLVASGTAVKLANG